MSLPRRDPARSNTNLPLALDEVYARVRNIVFSSLSPETPVGMLAEADGTVRQQLVGWKTEATAAQIRIRAEETTGELTVSNYGNVSGTPTAFKVESTGEQDIVLHGKDSAGPNIDPLLTSTEKVLYVESRDPGEYVSPDDMPGTNTTYYTNNNTGFLADVEIEVVNTSGAAATATVDVVENGGSAAANRRILAAVPITPASVGIRLGAYTLNVGGTVEGLCSVADACTIHVYVVSLRRITP